MFEDGKNWGEESFVRNSDNTELPEFEEALELFTASGFQYGEEILAQEEEFEAENAGSEFTYYMTYYDNDLDWQESYNNFGTFNVLVMCDDAAFFVCNNSILSVEYNDDYTALIYKDDVLPLVYTTVNDVNCIKIESLGLVLSYCKSRDTLEYYLNLDWK